MNLETVLNFFKKDRKRCFLILLVVYIFCLLIPDKMIETSFIVETLVIVSLFTPICLYNYIGWKDITRDEKKRSFSRFSFFFISVGILGYIVLSIWEAKM